MMNVYVAGEHHPTQPFRKILSIGQLPPGGVAETVEIDVLRLKADYSPQVNDILDPSKIDDLYDIKTSAGGKITHSQKLKLISVRGGDIRISMCARKWTASQGWHNNPRILKITKILGLVGLGASAYAIINSASYDDEVDEIIIKLDVAQGTNDPDQRRIAVTLVMADVRNYINHFDPSPITDMVMLGMIYHILGQDW